MGILIDDDVLEMLRHEDDFGNESEDWLDKILELYSSDEFDEDEDLMHYGVAHDANPPGPGSGRYPFGSGDKILQRHWDLYSRYRKMKNATNPETGKKYTETEIAGLLGFYQTDRNGNPYKDSKGNPKPSTSVLRARMTASKNYIRQEGFVKEIAKYDSENDPDTGKPYTNTKIAKLLGINESSVRNYRNSDKASENASKAENAAKKLKEIVDAKQMVDVGRGVELSLKVSPTGLKTALELLKQEGYQVAPVWIDQVGGTMGNKTIINTLFRPDVDYMDVVKNRFNIPPVENPDGESSATLLGIKDPVRVSLDRVKVIYDEQGGTKKDGLIEIRGKLDKDGKLVAACEDLSLGDAKYGQVRIATEGDMFIKGMAVYNTNLPKGVDIVVNSNKHESQGIKKALKPMEKLKDKDGNEIGVDPDNPFGSTVWQSEYVGKDGKSHLSAINVVGDLRGVDKHLEGAWGEWSKNTASQFLGKQSEQLIRQQLKLKVQEKQAEYDEIMKLNNPVVKQQLLKEFADGCDRAAVDLKAAPFPGQRVHVILPLTTIKENEVYAPNYPNGTTLALIRFPHTGPFEIPIVKVNNNNKEANSFLKDARGEAKDAIGIHSKTAAILSGADFDGDTVAVIPMSRKNSQGEFERTVNIKGLGNGQSKLPDLDDFNPSEAWPGVDSQGNPFPGVKLMDKRTKGIEMGVVSNLITDMSIKGCTDANELSRAVRYSMVVIDAYKHKLDYKAAEKFYNIKELKEKYQVNSDGTHGVSTLLSRAKSEVNDIPQRQAWTPNKGHIDKATGLLVGNTIDPETGEKIYKLAPNRFYETTKMVRVKDPETGKWEKNEDGTFKKVKVTEVKERMTKSTRMAEAKNAEELLSENYGNKEKLYADFANRMKAMANQARKDWLATPELEFNPEAKKKYKAEVDSLNKKYIDAKKNAPRERQAQMLANQIVKVKLQENPNMDGEEKKRMKGQALNGARARTGASKQRVVFTEKEWEAINAGAISKTRLKDLLENGDPDNYKSLATPKTSRISEATIARIQGLLNAGWTRADIEAAGYASMETIKKVQNGTA